MFILTFCTILVAGAFHAGADFIKDPVSIFKGLPFAVALIGILLSHELAHYFASRIHGIRATLPLFIPAPPPIIFGTFGAFIKMKSPILSRKALIDIGASGPIAGFIISSIATVTGLNFSEVVPVKGVDGGLYLGSSLLFSFLSNAIHGPIPEGHDVFLHPVAFAGWIGFFITSLNLIPIGQLDGGHIAFALLRRKHRAFSLILLVGLILMGTLYWPGWLMWALLLVILGIQHPPIIHEEVRLDGKRIFLGITCFLIFVITFTPLPISITFH